MRCILGPEFTFSEVDYTRWEFEDFVTVCVERTGGCTPVAASIRKYGFKFIDIMTICLFSSEKNVSRAYEVLSCSGNSGNYIVPLSAFETILCTNYYQDHFGV